MQSENSLKERGTQPYPYLVSLAEGLLRRENATLYSFADQERVYTLSRYSPTPRATPLRFTLGIAVKEPGGLYQQVILLTPQGEAYMVCQGSVGITELLGALESKLAAGSVLEDHCEASN